MPLLNVAFDHQKQQLAMWKVISSTSHVPFKLSRSVFAIVRCVTAQIMAEKEALFDPETITHTLELRKIRKIFKLTMYDGSDGPARLPTAFLALLHSFTRTSIC